MEKALIIFTRVPTAGQVKTRLIPFLTPQNTSKLQECFFKDTIDLAVEVNCDVIVLYYPPDGLASLKALVKASNLKFVVQEGSNLGERMLNAFGDVFKMGYQRIVMIGTDLPTLPLHYLDKAFNLLKNFDVVIGPNIDGGYYLIGMQSLEREVFEGIDWGTGKVMLQTLERIKGLKLGCLDVWYDVDAPADLKFLKSHLEYLKICGEKIPERTYRFLKELEL